MTSKPTRRDLVLRLLREAGSLGVTTAGFVQAGAGIRFGARLGELRERGYVIGAERIGEGAWRYTLLGEPPDDLAPAQPAAPSTPEPMTAAPLNALTADVWEGDG